jgi:hypothetical protein
VNIWHTLKVGLLWYVNCISTELLFKKYIIKICNLKMYFSLI